AWIGGVVLHRLLVCGGWGVIEDGGARTSPPVAVGLLFTPFFNLYWLFVAYFGLALDTNSYAERHEIRIRPVNHGLALASCVLLVLGCFMPVCLLVGVVLQLFVMRSVKNAAAAIAEARCVRTAPAACSA